MQFTNTLQCFGFLNASQILNCKFFHAIKWENSPCGLLKYQHMFSCRKNLNSSIIVASRNIQVLHFNGSPHLFCLGVWYGKYIICGNTLGQQKQLPSSNNLDTDLQWLVIILFQPHTLGCGIFVMGVLTNDDHAFNSSYMDSRL